MTITRSAYIVIAVAIVAVAAYGISLNVAQAATQSNTGQNNGTDSVTLVITTNNQFNRSIGDQPSYFLLQNGTLKSTAVLNFPSDKKISLTIINYDNGSASVPTKYDKVIGTLNDQITVVNNTNVNSSETSGKLSVSGGITVSQVPDSNIAHTFTVLTGSNAVLNIPVPPSSVVHATFTLNSGSYTWQCQAACGSGPAGWGGAMSTPGWMTGSVFVN